MSPLKSTPSTWRADRVDQDDQDDLAAGHKFEGPAIIVEQTATTVVPPGFDVTVDEFGSLVIRTQDVEGN